MIKLLVSAAGRRRAARAWNVGPVGLADGVGSGWWSAVRMLRAVAARCGGCRSTGAGAPGPVADSAAGGAWGTGRAGLIRAVTSMSAVRARLAGCGRRCAAVPVPGGAGEGDPRRR
ncbi:hypothetical protein GCM10027570_21730 [Streptomonospora sediminis]